MKVAIYVSELDIRGGTHKQVLKLVDYLVANSHEVTIFTLHYNILSTYSDFSKHNIVKSEFSKIGGGKIIRLVRGICASFKLAALSSKFDVVNVHDLNSNSFIIFNYLFGQKNIIWQINDLDRGFGVGNASGYSGKIAFFRRFFSRLAMRCVREVTVNVTKNAERVKEHLNRNAAVIYCGVDFLQPRATIPKINDKLIIVSTGVLFRYRNYEAIIAACQIIQNKFPSMHMELHIVGDLRYESQYTDSLINLAKELNVNMKLRGSISEQELNSLYDLTSVFCFVNIDQSWGLAVFEAASKGIPVVLSKSVGAVELLANKPGVFIVDPLSPVQIAESILAITKNQQVYEHFCDEAKVAVNRMSWDEMYSKNVELLYQKMMKQ